jgi:hypothetical protein
MDMGRTNPELKGSDGPELLIVTSFHDDVQFALCSLCGIAFDPQLVQTHCTLFYLVPGSDKNKQTKNDINRTIQIPAQMLT